LPSIVAFHGNIIASCPSRAVNKRRLMTCVWNYKSFDCILVIINLTVNNNCKLNESHIMNYFLSAMILPFRVKFWKDAENPER
jgi:hypothetical protein